MLRRRTSARAYGVTAAEEIGRVLKSYRDFVALCERKERDSGVPCLIIARERQIASAARTRCVAPVSAVPVCAWRELNPFALADIGLVVISGRARQPIYKLKNVLGIERRRALIDVGLIPRSVWTPVEVQACTGLFEHSCNFVRNLQSLRKKPRSISVSEQMREHLDPVVARNEPI